jgi:hypothetical protein
MFRNTLRALAVALVLSPAACAPTRYAYAPVTSTTTSTSAELVGHPAADYAFPPGSPHGRVRLATFGVAQVTATSPWFFHLRMVATNQGDEPWTIDKNEQRLQLAIGDDGKRSASVQPTTDVDGSPARVEVAPGETKTVDLYFPRAPGARDAAEVPAFETIWTVHVGSRAITIATPFERFLASGAAKNVPRPEHRYPLDDPTTNATSPENRLPGTPDTRWPPPTPDSFPRAPLP